MILHSLEVGSWHFLTTSHSLYVFTKHFFFRLSIFIIKVLRNEFQINPINMNFQLQTSFETFDKNSADKIQIEKY